MSKDSKAKKTKKHYKSLEKKTALWGLIFLEHTLGCFFYFNHQHFPPSFRHF